MLIVLEHFSYTFHYLGTVRTGTGILHLRGAGVRSKVKSIAAILTHISFKDVLIAFIMSDWSKVFYLPVHASEFDSIPIPKLKIF